MKNCLKYKYASFILTAIIFSACGNTAMPEQDVLVAEANQNVVQLTAAQLKNTALKIGKLEKRTVSSLVKVNGVIDVPPQNLISISVPLGGYLKSTELIPGMHIHKGETIAIMEDQQYIQLQQDYLTTAANLTYAELDYNRQRELNQSKASSDKALQQAEAAYKNLKVTKSALGEKLRLIGITPDKLTEANLSRSISIPSPIDGYVSAVHVNIGKYVNPSDVLFELINPNDIHLSLTVFEKDLDKLSPGQKLMAYTNSNPEKKYPCEIALIGKDLSDERSVEVHCHFQKFEKQLIPGMFMNAEIEVNSNNSYTVEEDALVRFDSKNYIFIAKGTNQFQMVEVETGIKEKGFVEIKNSEALSAKPIVTKGAYTLLMKMKNKSDE